MKKEQIKKIIFILFCVYIIALFLILFFGRYRHTFGLGVFSKEHLSMVNIIPFSTVFEFFKRLGEHTINTNIVLRNLAANLLLFVPMGMALPVLFEKKFNKLWKVALFVAGLVLVIEIAQFLTFFGSADIDDLILNTAGAIVGYGIVRIKFIQKILKIA